MWKIFKSKKALSPVVAAIILIAVTVAVSIAVAAWMGALTFTFMKTEELKFVSHTWGASNAYIDLKVRNTGTSPLTLSGAEVNSASATANATGTVAANAETIVRITQGFTSGQKYEFAIKTAAGNKYTYIATAP
jgi:flagellin-like protein